MDLMQANVRILMLRNLLHTALRLRLLSLMSPQMMSYSFPGRNPHVHLGLYYKTITKPSTRPKISNWRIVEGPGTLTHENNTTFYKAPSPLTAKSATIEVTLTNLPPIKDSKAPGGVRGGGEMKLLTYISLLHGWIKVTLGGQQYMLKSEITAGTGIDKTFGVRGQAVLPDGRAISAVAGVFIDEHNRPKAGSYPFGFAKAVPHPLALSLTAEETGSLATLTAAP